MGAVTWIALLITHPLEFKTLLQFWMYHEQNRDTKVERTQGAPYVWVRPSIHEEMLGVLGHNQQELFSGYKRAGRGSGKDGQLCT